MVLRELLQDIISLALTSASYNVSSALVRILRAHIHTLNQEGLLKYRNHDILNLLPEEWMNTLCTSPEVCEGLMGPESQVCFSVLYGLLYLSSVLEMGGAVFAAKVVESDHVALPHMFQ